MPANRLRVKTIILQHFLRGIKWKRRSLVLKSSQNHINRFLTKVIESKFASFSVQTLIDLIVNYLRTFFFIRLRLFHFMGHKVQSMKSRSKIVTKSQQSLLNESNRTKIRSIFSSETAKRVLRKLSTCRSQEEHKKP